MSQQQTKKKGRDGRSKTDIRFYGLVRAVPSGDTVQILELSDSRNTASLKEIQLTLLGLKAPTFGRKTVKDGKVHVEKDQPWAFESREFLRKLVIGKCVVYRVEHDAGDRHYGEVWLDDENLRFKIVKEGWADVLPKTGRKGKDGNDAEPTEDYLELLQCKETAEKQGLGKWQKDSKKCKHIIHRDAVSRGEEELFAFFEKHRDKPQPGIVEQVRSGSALRVLLAKTMDNIPLQLSGVRSPAYKFNDEAGCEPFSREAKFFTEHYLLNRDVTVTIEGFDNFNNFFGTVTVADGFNPCLNLLKMGLAVFVEWTAPKNQSLMKQFREAEKQAQEAKLRIWSNVSAQAKGKKTKESTKSPAQQRHDASSFTGKVIEIANAGTIVVRVHEKGDRFVDRRITLASISVPRVLSKYEEARVAKKREKESHNAEGLQKAKEEELEMKWQSAFALEAKELLRSKLIGEDVKCELDYTRTYDSTTDPERTYWSVSHKGQNVSLDLVSRGLAKVVRHAGDEPRARNYQDLIIAERNAQKTNKGLHGPKSGTPAMHRNDLTELPPRDKEEEEIDEPDELEAEGEEGAEKKSTPKSSKQSTAKTLASKTTHFLPFLKRAGKMNAVVEHVFSGSRFKLWIPSQSVVLFFSLAGVSTLKPERSYEKAAKAPNAPFSVLYPPNTLGNKALHFTRDRTYQRNVEVTVDAVDKGGNFIGQLTVQRQDIALKLLDEGLARIHSRSVDRLSNKAEYKKAQEKAQSAKIGIWHNYDAEAEAEKQAQREQERKAQKETVEQNAPERFQIAVTEIIDGSKFCYQVIGEETKALADLMNQFQQIDWAATPPHTPTKGEIVSAQFSHDNHWYRAQVTKVIDGGNYEVVYIDYGNGETVTADKVRKLTPDFSEKVLPRQARTGQLAYIIPPKSDDDFGRDAAATFKELVWGKTLTATMYTDYRTQTTSLVVGDPETGITINGALVGAGLARTEKRRYGNQYFQGLKEEEANARKNRLNIWQYGDLPDSDDEQ